MFLPEISAGHHFTLTGACHESTYTAAIASVVKTAARIQSATTNTGADPATVGMAVRSKQQERRVREIGEMMNIPSGWKLVPLRPSEAMNEAYNNVPSGFGGSPAHSSHVWEAMLATAPAAPVAAPAPSEQDKIDAERYRWLREKAGDMGGVSAPMCAMLNEEGAFKDLIDGDELDAAIDAARGAL